MMVGERKFSYQLDIPTDKPWAKCSEFMGEMPQGEMPAKNKSQGVIQKNNFNMLTIMESG